MTILKKTKIKKRKKKTRRNLSYLYWLNKRPHKIRITVGFNSGATMTESSNSGATKIKLITSRRPSTAHRKLPSASIGDLCFFSVVEGEPKLRRKIIPGTIIRQKKTWKRTDFMSVYCEDNAAVLLSHRGDLKGSAIQGSLTREAAKIWPYLATRASSVL